MNEATTTFKYLVDSPEFPYCNGCGHTWINKALDLALQELNIPPTKINLVSDIGCVGLVDKLFLTNTIHTTHGRSTAVASGVQIADQVLFANDAIHVIMIGDGGATLGLLHLVEAAKLNVNITILLHNNFVYGMTGGQNSGLTPEDFRTATTMAGNLTPSIHIAHLLQAAHAGFIARKLATDKDLVETIVEAIQYPGFSLVEVVELCTGYATKWNSLSKADIETILEKTDSAERGIIVKRNDRKNYGEIYQASFPKKEIKQDLKNLINTEKQLKLDHPISLVVAGSAGEGVQFASKTFLESALLHGLNVVQKNDNPVTIGTGFSISELKFSSEEILYSGIDLPEYLIISSLDGLNRAKEFISNIIKTKDTKSTVIIDSSLREIFQQTISGFETKFIIHSADFKKLASNSRSLNFVMLGYFYRILEILDFEIFKKAMQRSGKNSEALIDNANKGFQYNQ